MSKRSAIATVICSLTLLACSKGGSSPESETAASENPDLNAQYTPPASTAPSTAEQQTTAGMTDTTTQPPMAATPSPSTPTTPTDVGPAAQPAETLTDEQIAKITETVDTGEVEQAKIAQKKSKNKSVKKFAQMMVQHHTKSKKQNATVAKKAQITPADSATAQSLSEKSTQTVATLESAEPTDFDQKYIESQIEAHQNVVTLLDSKLIPAAQNAELKARLEETRKLVEEHLNEAREIQSNLATADSTAKPTREGAGTTGPGATGTGTTGTPRGQGTGTTGTGTP